MSKPSPPGQCSPLSAEHTDPTLITELWRPGAGQHCLALPKTRLCCNTGHTHHTKRNPPPTPLHLRESHHLHIQSSRKPSVLAEDRQGKRQQILLSLYENTDPQQPAFRNLLLISGFACSISLMKPVLHQQILAWGINWIIKHLSLLLNFPK